MNAPTAKMLRPRTQMSKTDFASRFLQFNYTLAKLNSMLDIVFNASKMCHDMLREYESVSFSGLGSGSHILKIGIPMGKIQSHAFHKSSNEKQNATRHLQKRGFDSCFTL